MKIAFYFSNAHLGAWLWADFVAGRMPASGTDAQFLHLLHRMSRRDDLGALPLFSGGIPEGAPEGAEAVRDLAEGATVGKARGADAIVFNNRNREDTLAGLARCEAVGLAAIAWDHNGPYPDFRGALFGQKALRRLVVVSASHADTLRGHPIFDKCVFIHNALLFVDPPDVRPGPNRDRTVCFLGATIPQKGFHHVVRAWPEVHRRLPDAQLMVLGSSRLYGRLRELGPLGLADREFEEREVIPYWGRCPEDRCALGITVSGLISPMEVAGTLRDCAIAVVNPCVRNGSFETFCVSAIEAQAAGCAVVGGRRLGLRESVRDGETGILIRREADLAEAIVGLLNDPAGTQRMGATGARWVRETFAAGRADLAWLAVFREVVEGRPTRPPRFRWRLATPKTIVGEVLRWGRAIPKGDMSAHD
jgi:glycosyltransferase involved in cell wall biosynthesis